MTATLTAVPTPVPMLTATVGDLVPAIKTLARQCPKHTRYNHPDGSEAIQFAAADGQLTLRQYNGEVMAETILPVATDDTFDFALNGHSFNTTLSKMVGRLTASTKASDIPVSYKEDAGTVLIDYDDIELMFPTTEWWTKLPEMPLRATLGEISASAIHQGWNKVKAALLDDDTYPILGAVNLRVHGNKAVLTATDRYRSAQFTTAFTDTGLQAHVAEVTAAARTAKEKGEKYSAFNPADGMSIPGDTLKNLVTMLPKDDTPVSLSLHADKYSVFLRFTFGDTRVSTTLRGANFPDVSSVFPSTINQRLTFNKKALVDRLTKLASQVGTTCMVEITPDGDTASLRAGFDRVSANEVTATIPMPASETVAPAQRFVIGRLIDAVQSVDTADVILAANVNTEQVTAAHMVQAFPGDTEFEAESGTVRRPHLDYQHLLITTHIPD